MVYYNLFPNYLPVDALINGGLYVLCSRHSYIGMWDKPANLFKLPRYQTGRAFLDIEYHFDNVGFHGTAKPLQYLFVLKEDKDLLSSLVKYLEENEFELKVIFRQYIKSYQNPN